MKRSPMPARRQEMRRARRLEVAGKGVTPRRRPVKALPGPNREERLVVAERSARMRMADLAMVVAWCCEVCGRILALPTGDGMTWVYDHSWHHRRPRGKGGDRDPALNTPPRLLLVCGLDNSSGCHGLIEQQRVLAKDNGWLVPRPTDPASVPVELHDGRRYLTPEGTYEEAS